MAESEDEVVRVHYGMTGSVPLTLVEFVFEPAGCYVLDCGSFTPLFGLTMGKHTRRAAAVDAAYREDGVDGLLAGANTVSWYAWDAVESVALHDGGRFTRPKLTVQPRDGLPECAVRLHGVEVASVYEALTELVSGRTSFRRVDGAGLF